MKTLQVAAGRSASFGLAIPLNKDDDARIEAIEKELIKLGSHVSVLYCSRAGSSRAGSSRAGSSRAGSSRAGSSGPSPDKIQTKLSNVSTKMQTIPNKLQENFQMLIVCVCVCVCVC